MKFSNNNSSASRARYQPDNANNHVVLPEVSVVIPAKNEENNIARVLEALGKQSYPADKFDILIMDNMSTDSTVELAQRFARVQVHTADGNIGAIRNIGANYTTGDVVAFLDADCIVPPDWLCRAVERLAEHPDIAIVGSVMKLEDAKKAPWVERCWIADHRARFTKDLTNVRSISSFCFCIRRDVLVESGGFNDSLATCEDQELGYRLTGAGWRIVIDRAIEVIHLGNAKTLKKFFLRQLWQGGSNMENTRGRRIDPGEIGSLAAPAIFIALLFIAAITLLLGASKIAFGAALTALAIGLLVTIKKYPTSDLLQFPAYFLIWSTYLLARGLGFVLKIKRTSR